MPESVAPWLVGGAGGRDAEVGVAPHAERGQRAGELGLAAVFERRCARQVRERAGDHLAELAAGRRQHRDVEPGIDQVGDQGARSEGLVVGVGVQEGDVSDRTGCDRAPVGVAGAPGDVRPGHLFCPLTPRRTDPEAQLVVAEEG